MSGKLCAIPLEILYVNYSSMILATLFNNQFINWLFKKNMSDVSNETSNIRKNTIKKCVKKLPIDINAKSLKPLYDTIRELC